jgi:hypothetical protein
VDAHTSVNRNRRIRLGIAIAATLMIATGVAAERRLSLAAFDAALDMAGATAHSQDSVSVVCVAVGVAGRTAGSDPASNIISALQRGRIATVLPRSRCDVESLGRDGDRSLVFEPATGRRGFIVAISPPAWAFWPRIGVTYYQGGRSAADWSCVGVPTWSGWRLGSCRMTRIS